MPLLNHWRSPTTNWLPCSMSGAPRPGTSSILGRCLHGGRVRAAVRSSGQEAGRCSFGDQQEARLDGLAALSRPGASGPAAGTQAHIDEDEYLAMKVRLLESLERCLSTRQRRGGRIVIPPRLEDASRLALAEPTALRVLDRKSILGLARIVRPGVSDRQWSDGFKMRWVRIGCGGWSEACT